MSLGSARAWRAAGAIAILGAAGWAAIALTTRTRSADGQLAAAIDRPETGVAGHDRAAGGVHIDGRRRQLTNVRIVSVSRGPLEDRIRAVGLVRYDETRLTEVSARADGWVDDLPLPTTGTHVVKGQTLLSLYSPELLTLQTEYVSALKTLAQVEASAPDAVAAADLLVHNARVELERRRVPADEIQAITSTKTVRTALRIESPVDGYVIDRTAVAGAHVAAGQTLYKLADLSRVWVEADVPQRDVATLRPETRATVSVDAYPDLRPASRLLAVLPYLDEKAHTNRVRLELDNVDGRLKPGMYANVELRIARGEGLIVPLDAVLDSGTEQVVFVALGRGYFEPRPVKVGARLGGEMVELLEGVHDGEQVASGATFFLDSENRLNPALEAFQGPAPSPAPPDGPESRAGITVQFNPDPPRTGTNRIDVVVKDSSGRPIDEADVSIQATMPAMPSMNMPAMTARAALARRGAGTYGGSLDLTMAGRWDATISVSRRGAAFESRRLTLLVR